MDPSRRALPLPDPPRRVATAMVVVAAVLASVAVLIVVALANAGGSAAASAPAKAHRRAVHRCPWLHSSASPTSLARQVIRRMDLAEKLDLVILRYNGPYENELAGIPSLCIPPITMQDGAAGVAYHARNVTQLPAPIALGATFDTALARQYGAVIAEEDRGKGIDVAQGPSLSLVRVPEAGRSYENFGEDPTLVSALGVAEIDGIQSRGIVAEATHLPAYTQETDRPSIDQIVSERALQELYLAPFRAAVEQAHVGSVMCAYGLVNGVRACQDDQIFDELASWGFDGFLRSDLDAVKSSVGAFDAGVDAIKPASTPHLRALVEHRRLSVRRLDDAVLHLLETMFRFGLIQHPLGLHPSAKVDSPAHAKVALDAAEESMVLLKDAGGVLPLPARTPSVALIGSGAGPAALSAGEGSAHVIAPFLSTPLSAITAVLGARRVRASLGSSPTAPLPAISPADLRSRSTSLLASESLGHHGPTGTEAQLASVERVRAVIERLADDGAAGTGSIPPEDFADLDRTEVTVVPPRSGLYAISLTGDGDTWLELDGRLLLADRGTHVRFTWQVATELRARQSYHLTMFWYPVAIAGAAAPRLGWKDETPMIERAAEVARGAKVVIVFAEAPSSEGVDRPDLSLPGAQDALVSAVAAANPRTVVVLNTPGAVAMPWIGQVAAVIEAWYPGEEDGRATAAVLFGTVDPSGRLPVSFPTAGDGVAGGAEADWPGVDGKVYFSGGLDIGYRYLAAEHLKALFPFGFGLSYTSFSLGAASWHRSGTTVQVRVPVTDSGHRPGSEVVQAYLSFPAAAAEPPIELVAFARVSLAPRQTRDCTLSVPLSAFEADINGRFTTVRGRYTLRIGTSSSELLDSLAVVPPLPSPNPSPRRRGSTT